MEQQDQQEQAVQSQESISFNILVKAAEKYLATLDDLARVPTQQHIQQAVNILASALAQKSEAQKTNTKKDK